MKRAVFVTAVTGSGKSTVCKALQMMGHEAVDIEDIPGLFSLVHEETGQPMPHHDNSKLELVRKGDWNCNKKKLEYLISNQTADIAFYCGAASNYEEIWNLFDQVITLHVSDSTTLERLSSRKLGEFGNSDEVRQWVLTWKAELEDKWLKAGATAVGAEESPERVAANLLKVTRT